MQHGVIPNRKIVVSWDVICVSVDGHYKNEYFVFCFNSLLTARGGRLKYICLFQTKPSNQPFGLFYKGQHNIFVWFFYICMIFSYICFNKNSLTIQQLFVKNYDLIKKYNFGQQLQICSKVTILVNNIEC